VSNSHGQREWIESERDRRGLSNLEIITADVNDFEPEGRFDRVMSIEMFEHMRNWRELLRRIAGWLEPETGRLFVHVFSHRTLPYRFVGTWAAARFFTAGLMPSHELMHHFPQDLYVTDEWIVPGTHYARTLSAWLTRLDASRARALEILRGEGRSEGDALRLLATWRLFFISTEVIWRYRRGNRWLVSHYLLRPRS
jgi:cyclopropane-fatty-acyl-phospholipid synthase